MARAELPLQPATTLGVEGVGLPTAKVGHTQVLPKAELRRGSVVSAVRGVESPIALMAASVVAEEPMMEVVAAVVTLAERAAARSQHLAAAAVPTTPAPTRTTPPA